MVCLVAVPEGHQHVLDDSVLLIETRILVQRNIVDLDFLDLSRRLLSHLLLDEDSSLSSTSFFKQKLKLTSYK